MKLEEILPSLREGKRIYNKDFDWDGEHWQLGFISIADFEKTKTILRYDSLGVVDRSKNSWGLPRWAILSDSWELFDDKKGD